MNRNMILTLSALVLVAGSLATAQSTTTQNSGTTTQAASPTSAEPTVIILTQKPSYPLHTCVACNTTLPMEPVDYVTSARLFRLDTSACKAAVDADVATMTKKVTDAVIAQQKPTYPMQVSAVSGHALGANPFDYVYGTRLVRLTDSSEQPLFDSNPLASMRRIDEAYIAAQLPTYTRTDCIVCKASLSAEGTTPVNHLYGTKLVRMCGASCVDTFDRNPEIYLRTSTR